MIVRTLRGSHAHPVRVACRIPRPSIPRRSHNATQCRSCGTRASPATRSCAACAPVLPLPLTCRWRTELGRLHGRGRHANLLAIRHSDTPPLGEAAEAATSQSPPERASFRNDPRCGSRAAPKAILGSTSWRLGGSRGLESSPHTSVLEDGVHPRTLGPTSRRRDHAENQLEPLVAGDPHSRALKKNIGQT